MVDVLLKLVSMGLIQGLQGWRPIGTGGKDIGAAFDTAQLGVSGGEETGSRVASRGSRQNGGRATSAWGSLKFGVKSTWLEERVESGKA